MPSEQLTMTAQDKKWEIESNARTLKEATEITMDTGKLKKAFAELKKQAKVANKTVMDVSRLFGKKG